MQVTSPPDECRRPKRLPVRGLLRSGSTAHRTIIGTVSVVVTIGSNNGTHSCIVDLVGYGPGTSGAL